MTRSLTLRAAFVSIVIFATFMIAWHLATRGTGRLEVDGGESAVAGGWHVRGQSCVPGAVRQAPVSWISGAGRGRC